ncbi:MAG: nuclear transport factor 2 family protein [Pseudomonadota bacterium]|nr:nuclear transport factor 2 family protein [Pseudomonadota bacterium]
MAGDEILVRDAVDRLGTLIRSRDPAFADEFDREFFLLVESDAGEVASTRSELESLLSGIYALPVQVTWRWNQVMTKLAGNVALVFAEGDLMLSGSDGIERRPYRMSGMLQRSHGRWLWRLFHGSEPAQP